jgi:membrane carboxypeptidase/penicillin-binding protein
VGSTYGASGITVAVRIGYDDNRPLGQRETGGRTALPIFRDIMLRVYEAQLVGQAPRFPREIEDGIDQYLAMLAVPELGRAEVEWPGRDPEAPLVGTGAAILGFVQPVSE